jgi:hypothetical protein
VFARFPRPFVLTGADGLDQFPPLPPRPLGECIAERLKVVDPNRPPQVGDVSNLIDGVLAATADEDAREEAEQTLQELLRDVEMEYGQPGRTASSQTPWVRYRRLVQDHLLAVGGAAAVDTPPAAMPAAAFDDEEDDE